MMKNVLALLVLCCGSWVWAEPIATTLEIQQCRMRLIDIYNGEILKPRIENDFKYGGYSATVKLSQSKNSYRFGFSLSCQSSDDPIVNSRLAQQNPKTGVWEKDLEKWFGKLTPEERRVLDKATRVFNLKAPNSSGYAFTEEATTGDEFGRERRMIFCLFHPPKAICGGGVVGVLRDGSKGDLTQHALKIIQSIEFLPDASPEGVPATTRNSELQK